MALLLQYLLLIIFIVQLICFTRLKFIKLLLLSVVLLVISHFFQSYLIMRVTASLCVEWPSLIPFYEFHLHLIKDYFHQEVYQNLQLYVFCLQALPIWIILEIDLRYFLHSSLTDPGRQECLISKWMNQFRLVGNQISVLVAIIN